MRQDSERSAPVAIPFTSPVLSTEPSRVVHREYSSCAIAETITPCAGSCPTAATMWLNETKCSRCRLSCPSNLARPQRGPCDPAAVPPLR